MCIRDSCVTDADELDSTCEALAITSCSGNLRCFHQTYDSSRCGAMYCAKALQYAIDLYSVMFLVNCTNRDQSSRRTHGHDETTTALVEELSLIHI